MTAPGQDFADLVARARRGDSAAVAELVRRYEPDVRVVARLRLGTGLRPYLDSVDLVQSVHKSLLRGLRQDRFDLTNPGQLVALALAMVRRKAARHWRRLRRQRRLEAGPGDSTDLPAVLASLSSPRADPADAARFNDDLAHVCDRLDPTERRVIELRMDGYTRAEIAGRLGMPANELIACFARIRRRFQGRGVFADWL
jgi:RNA polymerase sigma factor (sigma-70 family)